MASRIDSRALRDLQRESDPPPSLDSLDASDPIVGSLVAERYRVVRKLADGAQAAIYLAKHALIKRQVALKILTAELSADPELVKSFLDEGQVAGTMGHPNIIESHDMGVTEDGRPYLVLEYLEGMSLAEEVHYRGVLEPGRAAYVGVQIASALVAAHARGIIHRDLKPDNVLLVNRDGRKDHVKIVDFGISKVASSGKRGLDGLIVGTPDYMAPEQVTSPRDIDGRADVFALGACLYEALSGRSPLDLQHAKDPLGSVVDAKPEPLSRLVAGVPQGLLAVIEKAMQKDRDRRFASMAELGAALEPFASLPESAPASSRQPISGVSLDALAATESGRFEAAAITGSYPSLLAKSTNGPVSARPTVPTPVDFRRPKRRNAVVAAAVVVCAFAGVGLLATRHHGAEAPTATGAVAVNNIVASPVASPTNAQPVAVPVTAAPPVVLAGAAAPRPVMAPAAARLGGATRPAKPGAPASASAAAEPAETAAPVVEAPKVAAAATHEPAVATAEAPKAMAPVAPAAVPTGIVPFGAGMTRPSPVSAAEIKYTREAREANVEGTMIVRCVITTAGTTQNCRVIKSLPFMDGPVLAAFAAHKGTPVMQNGQPINADYTFTIRLKRD